MKLELPRTKIRVEEGMFSKSGKNGDVATSFDLNEIEAIRIDRYRDYGAVGIFSGSSLALAVVSKIYIPSEGWSWVVGIIFLAISLFCILLINSRRITIETCDGKVSFPINDPFEDADGFVLSVRKVIKGNTESGRSSE